MYIRNPKMPSCHSENSSMFTHQNPYGYLVNINHPRISKLYDRYKKKNNIPPWCPMSDDERYDFENLIFEWFKLGKAHAKKEST